MATTEGEIRRRLLAWFDGHARSLPWRGDPDPYRIWVSEVMLQQTRVETVIPYYRRWLDRFPDVESLARADVEDVLGVWKGLGYYSRARNLHRAARLVRDRHGGRLPTKPAELRELPGVGRYTAGAVASLAFDRAVPAGDGNARRVLTRLFDSADQAPGHLESLAAALLDPHRPGDLNQALMELGATVCTPAGPDCGRCPVEDRCRARARGTVERRPAPRGRSPVREVEVGVAVIAREVGGSGARDGDGEEGVDSAGGPTSFRVLLRRRPPEGLLGGMLEFPGEEMGAADGGEVAARRAAARCGVRLPGSGTVADGRAVADGRPVRERGSGARRPVGGEPGPVPLPPVPHRYSHLKARYHPFLWRLKDGGDEGSLGDGARDGGPVGLEEDLLWAEAAELDALALPVAQQKIAEHLASAFDT